MTKQKLITIISIIMLTPAFVISSFAQKKVELKYNMNEGDVYNYTIDSDQDIVLETNGTTMALDNSYSLIITQKVSEFTADSMKIEGMITRAKSTASIFGMIVAYDTDDPNSSQNPMAAKIGEELNKVLNKPFFMTMDHKGNMGAINVSSISENDDVAQTLNAGGQFGIYPDGKISVGETWEKQLLPVQGSDMKIDAVYTLLKITGKQATIGFEGKISSNNFQGDELRINGSMKGSMIVDVKTGWLIESTMDQELELDFEQNGMTIPGTVDGTTITKSSIKN